MPSVQDANIRGDDPQSGALGMNPTLSARWLSRSRLWRFVRDSERFASSPAVRGRVRLRTLSNLRWLAIAGQSATLILVRFGLNYRLPLVSCMIAIALSVTL